MARLPVVHDGRPDADVERASTRMTDAFHVATAALQAITEPRKVKAGDERKVATAALEAVDQALGLSEGCAE
jgi:hypothetical protein